MSRFACSLLVGLGSAVLSAGGLLAAENNVPVPDLSEYRTVATAVAAQPLKEKAAALPGFLGVHVEEMAGHVVADEVATDSPAMKAGLKKGDRLIAVDGRAIAAAESFRDVVRTKSAGEAIKLTVQRDGKPLDLTATLAAPSRPQKPGAPRALLGIEVEPRKNEDGVVIKSVTPNTAAERARLKTDEVLLKIDGVAIGNIEKLREVVATKKPDDEVTLTMLLADKQVDYKVRLGVEGGGGGRGFGRGGAGGPGTPGWDARRSPYWTKDSYKLAVIVIEYPDAKANEKIPTKAWDDAMFSKGFTYKTTATGQTAHGSLYDYYLEQSYGHLKVSGKTFAPVKVSKKRAEYGASGTNRSALLTEALDELLKRDGKDALKDYDGIIYIYAGPRMQVARGSLYWPHRSSVRHQGKSWPYFICGEGSERNGVVNMGNISVFCHEFGHMLGMPDLYARPENPGQEGLAIWCAMANQAGNGRPQHFSAWCKEKLGWIKPTTIDPTVPQKLILGAIEDSPKECIKVLVKPDGSEYLLLENRRKKGFDVSLPAEGLLIWRVVGNRPILEESHGVEGPNGPRVFNTSVPFPSAANDAFTPYTTPTSRSQLGGGLPVHITNIRRLPDGRIAFQIGYEYQ